MKKGKCKADLCLIWEAGRYRNPGKYFLYNDLLVGLMDYDVTPHCGEHYSESAKKLKAAEAGNFGWLFEPLTALCDLLASKATMGVRLKKAYDDGDADALRELAQEIRTVTIPRFDTFQDAVARQWERENKAFGYEILDHRLGGVRRRLMTAAATVERYCRGELPAIDMLSEKRLPSDCRDVVGTLATGINNKWMKTMSPSYLYMLEL